LLRVTPRTDADRAEILAGFADRLLSQAGAEIVLNSDDAFVETFLAQFGSRISALSNEVPSLESVFLSLTGRELRDQAASVRERTAAFGRRGGEHTR